jgi:hypothetical protein
MDTRFISKKNIDSNFLIVIEWYTVMYLQVFEGTEPTTDNLARAHSILVLVLKLSAQLYSSSTARRVEQDQES